MLDVVLQRKLLALDKSLLEKAAPACYDIGYLLTPAFEGRRRVMYRDLCTLIINHGIKPTQQSFSSSSSPHVGIIAFGALVVYMACTPPIRRQLGRLFRRPSPAALEQNTVVEGKNGLENGSRKRKVSTDEHPSPSKKVKTHPAPKASLSVDEEADGASATDKTLSSSLVTGPESLNLQSTIQQSIATPAPNVETDHLMEKSPRDIPMEEFPREICTEGSSETEGRPKKKELWRCADMFRDGETSFEEVQAAFRLRQGLQREIDLWRQPAATLPAQATSETPLAATAPLPFVSGEPVTTLSTDTDVQIRGSEDSAPTDGIAASAAAP